jgi:putative aminopeptidase FrvX
MQSIDLLERLLAIDSPTGFTHAAADMIEQTLREYGYSPVRTRKGAVRCTLGEQPRIAFAAHTDTLGAIVSGFNPNGTLRFSLLGGPLLPSFEGGYVRIHTLDGRSYTGTLLLNDPSTHANNLAGTKERSISTMHVRIDEKVSKPDDVRGLGIRIGDIIAFDPKFQRLANGYIKSHFLDNKAGCAVLFDVARRCAESGRSVPVELFFSTYEEVGHGGAPSLSDSIQDLIVIDMGVVGVKGMNISARSVRRIPVVPMITTFAPSSCVLRNTTRSHMRSMYIRSIAQMAQPLGVPVPMFGSV